MPPSPRPEAPIRDAATVVLLQRQQSGPPLVLMGMRGAGAAFMASKFVFPGGAVDPDDAGPDPITTCARRELREETGLVLAEAAPLHLFFRAITPPGRPRRFDARFYIADAAGLDCDPADFTAADPELSRLQWVDLDAARRLDLPFITEVVLAEVAQLAARPGPLTTPEQIPFFDNSGPEPRFCYLPR